MYENTLIITGLTEIQRNELAEKLNNNTLFESSGIRIEEVEILLNEGESLTADFFTSCDEPTDALEELSRSLPEATIEFRFFGNNELGVTQYKNGDNRGRSGDVWELLSEWSEYVDCDWDEDPNA